MKEPGRRLFFALWPSAELRYEIAAETRQAVVDGGGRAIPPANFHVTLAFLGSLPESRLTEVKACARTITVHPFEFEMGQIKWWRRQELLCLEPIARVEMLQDIASRLQSTLRLQGLPIEHRPFRAHLTLARDVRHAGEFSLIRRLRWQVNRIELIESKTATTGSVYTVLPT